MRLSNSLMTIATFPPLLLLGSQRTLFGVCVPETSVCTMRSSCSIGPASVGWLVDSVMTTVVSGGLGGVEEVLCERQREVDASVRRGITRKISGVEKYPGPREPFRERHGGIIVFLGTMGRVFAQDAKDPSGGRIAGPTSAHWGLGRFVSRSDKRMPPGHQC
jgi:hypothetical protein